MSLNYFARCGAYINQIENDDFSQSNKYTRE